MSPDDWELDSITLVRHGESKANTRELDAGQHGDHAIPLTEEGVRQATATGARLAPILREKTLVYCSPYARTRQTLENLLRGAGVERSSLAVYEDPRLREVEHGYGTIEDYERQHPLRERHGWFYYRFEGGESPADCFDRVSGFVESMWRQTERKTARRVLIVSHGLTIRCFVMRFLHLTVEEFDSMANPHNASVIEIVPATEAPGAVFKRGRWAARGLLERADG